MARHATNRNGVGQPSGNNYNNDNTASVDYNKLGPARD